MVAVEYSMESLPVIDFSKPDREATSKELVKAMETVGFLYLDNVPGYDKNVEDKLLEVSEWFFSLTLEEKLKLSTQKWYDKSKSLYRGYCPINLKENHLREQYEMGGDLPDDDPHRRSGNFLYEETPWPGGEEGEKFHQLFMSHYSKMTDAAMEFLSLTAIGLGLEEHTFDKEFMPNPVSSLRTMHYPTYGETETPTFTCEEHFDGTFVTLLVTFSYEGLEILRGDGQWLKVEPRPGSLIVNIGDLLSRVTKRRFKTTVHRVRDTGIERYSVPYFFEPRSDGKFEIEGLGKITYGPWLAKFMKRFEYQYGHLPELPED